jgi:hypothetical protein
MKDILTILAIFFVISNSFAQDKARTTVILYNVTPLKVDLAPDGTIINIHGRDDDYFKGYSLVRNTDPMESGIAGANGFFKPKDGFTVANKVFNLDYKPDLALLTRSSIASIDEAVVYLLANPAEKLLITPYKTAGTKDEKILFDNRMKTALMYLEIKGLSKQQIAMNEVPQTAQADKMILTFIK